MESTFWVRCVLSSAEIKRLSASSAITDLAAADGAEGSKRAAHISAVRGKIGVALTHPH